MLDKNDEKVQKSQDLSMTLSTTASRVQQIANKQILRFLRLTIMNFFTASNQSFDWLILPRLFWSLKFVFCKF